MNDKDVGLKVLKSFYNWSRHYNPSTFKISFNDFLLKLQPNPKKLDIALDALGMGVREADMSDSRIDKAMTQLALSAQGKIPSNVQDFFKYLSNEAVKISYSDAALYVAAESLKNVGSAAQSIGDSLIMSGKVLNFLLPAIVVFFAYVYLNKASGGELKSSLGAFKR